MRGCHEARIYLAGSDARAGDFALAATAVLQIASGALSNQHVLEEKTVAGWVAENQTALLPDDPWAAGGQATGRERYGRKPLVLANHTAEYRQRAAQAVDIEVSLHEDFSSVISVTTRFGLAPWENQQ